MTRQEKIVNALTWFWSDFRPTFLEYGLDSGWSGAVHISSGLQLESLLVVHANLNRPVKLEKLGSGESDVPATFIVTW